MSKKTPPPPAKKITPAAHKANIKNSNAGTSGVNVEFQQAQSNRAKQIAESQEKAKQLPTKET